MGVKSLILGIALGVGGAAYLDVLPDPVIDEAEKTANEGNEKTIIEKWKTSVDAMTLSKQQQNEVINSWHQSLYAKREALKQFVSECKDGNKSACNDAKVFMEDIQVALKQGPSSDFAD
jgi:hypothetical protein